VGVTARVGFSATIFFSFLKKGFPLLPLTQPRNKLHLHLKIKKQCPDETLRAKNTIFESQKIQYPISNIVNHNSRMSFIKTTEQSSKYEALEKMSVADLLTNINQEDQTVPLAVAKVLPQIEKLVQEIVAKMKLDGRLFYIGAGTSGRLGIVDASECPPTFGVPFDLVNGIIAGGDKAIRRAVEMPKTIPRKLGSICKPITSTAMMWLSELQRREPHLMSSADWKNAMKITLQRVVSLAIWEVHYRKPLSFLLKSSLDPNS
jgi:phosphoribosylcarboxyaminoimidazole (NCAIR) mutase